MQSSDRALVYRLIDQTRSAHLIWTRTQETPVERFEAAAPPFKFTLTGGQRRSNAFLPFVLAAVNEQTGTFVTKVTESPGAAGLLLNLFREVTGAVEGTSVSISDGIGLAAVPEAQAVLAAVAADGADGNAVGDLTEDRVAQIGNLSMQQMDELPYGLMLLDRDGRVLFYNVNESQRSGMAREDVEGRNFFTEVAPCTNVKEFYGRFEDLVEGRSSRLIETFNFTFQFPDGVQHVVIVMSQNRRTGGVRVIVLGRPEAI